MNTHSMASDPIPLGHVPSAGASAYYQAAQRWDADRYRRMEVSRNRAWAAVGVCLLSVAAMAFAVARLASAHSVEVVTIAYNEANNMVRPLRYSDQVEQITSHQGFIKNQVYQFLQALETYDPVDQDVRLGLVRHFASKQLYPQLASAMTVARSSDKAGMPKRLQAVPVVHSINSLSARTVHVQFSLEETYDGNTKQTLEFASVLTFSIDGKPATAAEAMVNPFNFRVESYRRDATAR